MKELKVTRTTKVYGLKVRTNNSDELNLQTAQIGKMWQDFYSKVAIKLDGHSKIFGVYCNYESDASGDFDVFACSEKEISNQESTLLREGRYLVFEGSGEMPTAVIKTWQEIWNYFSSDKCQHSRAYVTDYEIYENEKEVSIYIGIK